MKKALALSALLIAFAIGSLGIQAQTAYAQPQSWHGVLTASDQSDFDRDYAKWMEATRTGRSGGHLGNASKMDDQGSLQHRFKRVPYDAIATPGASY